MVHAQQVCSTRRGRSPCLPCMYTTFYVVSRRACPWVYVYPYLCGKQARAGTGTCSYYVVALKCHKLDADLSVLDRQEGSGEGRGEAWVDARRAGVEEERLLVLLQQGYVAVPADGYLRLRGRKLRVPGVGLAAYVGH